MTKNMTSAESVNMQCINEAVCIHTGKIFDSCMDKDCIEDLRVCLCPKSQAIVDTAISIRPKTATLLNAYVRVEEINFNKGCYSVDVTYFYRVTGEAFPCDRFVSGLAIFEKRVLLYGGTGGSKTFSSKGGPIFKPNSNNLPTAVVEAVDPLPLSMKIADCPICEPSDGELRDIPKDISDFFEDGLVTSICGKQLYVTLGQFSIIRLERETQLEIPIYNYCIPDKECVGSEDDPCTLFESIPFPVEDFFPIKGDPSQCIVKNNT